MRLLALLSLVTPVLAAPPVVIAHRGASGYLPEHTLEAKVLAHGMGADFIEQDVVLTRDDVPVVLHDIHLEGVTDVMEVFPQRQRTDGHYYALDFTLAEIRQLHARERFNAKTGKAVYPNRYPTGQGTFRVPTLEEELALIAGLNHSTGRKVGIYPELKQPKWHREQGHDISAVVLAALRKHGHESPESACYLQCFEHEEVLRLRSELGWKGKLIQLLNAKSLTLCEDKNISALAQIVTGIGPPLSVVIDAKGQLTDLIRRAHQTGLKVHPYTYRQDDLPKGCADGKQVHQLLLEAKVDGLFTDFPDVTARYFKGS
jgi:glycerophosphoryl diester phosphodiesterase